MIYQMFIMFWMLVQNKTKKTDLLFFIKIIIEKIHELREISILFA